MPAFGSAVNSAHMTSSDHSILGVIGTMGTADSRGTALTLPASVDPDTGAWFIKPISGFITAGFSTITASYPTGTTEQYVYSSAAGTAGTLLVTYTDSTKGSISTVVKTP